MENNWYLWLSLTKKENPDIFVEDHDEIRNTFEEFSKKYHNLKTHNGNLIPKGIIVWNTKIPSCRYCMAKTSEEFKSELESLKLDLIKKSLENRIIGPTDNKEIINKFMDNFEIERIY